MNQNTFLDSINRQLDVLSAMMIEKVVCKNTSCGRIINPGEQMCDNGWIGCKHCNEEREVDDGK